MHYSEFVDLYGKLCATSKKLEKVSLLADFLKVLKKKGKSEWIYLLRGRVLPDYDPGEFGISGQLVIKALSTSFGVSLDKVVQRFKEIGDFGEVAEELAEKRKQSVLFSKKLSVEKVFDNLNKIITIEGKGSVDKKMSLISELFSSASSSEAKYIVRTLLNDLRVGVADALLIDSICLAFLDVNAKDKLEEAYFLANDSAVVFDAAAKGEKELERIEVAPGKPIKVMLPIKVNDLEEAFRICGRPAAFEHKYDGFRMIVTKKDNEIKLFTRKLENVTNQFPDVVEVVRNNVKGKSFILDSEVVGYDPRTKKYKPFEAISQRIKRKYDIERLIGKLPVEINVFDVLYHDGKSLFETHFSERRKILEKIVKVSRFKIRPSFQMITDDTKKAIEFYKKALKMGEEGVMIKKLDAPYKQGRRVGYLVKMKPVDSDLDLVIVGAEYGTGKRAGWLSSYVLACRDGKEFLEIGRVSSGLKEKEEEGTTYEEITNLLKPLVISEKGSEVKVRPKMVVSVIYQNIQKSPSYSSGYALRFPRITKYRPDRDVHDIASLDDIEKEVKRVRK